MSGFGGVSLVGKGNGTQLGAAADRMVNEPVARTVLAPGERARAPLQITRAANYGDKCDLVTADGVRLYPPDQTEALYTPYKVAACDNPGIHLLQIGPFQSSS